MRRTVVALALLPLLAGCGEKKETLGAPPGPDRPAMRMSVEGRPGSANAWAQQVRLRRGDELALRVRLRNGGRQETPFARLSVDLPAGMKIERATAAERAVETPALGDPIDLDRMLSDDGFDLGPFGGYDADVITLATRVTGAGTVKARLEAEGGTSTDELRISVR